MLYAILLSGIGRCSVTSFHGNSGKSHKFIWNNDFRALAYAGRALTREEFEKVRKDIFTADNHQNIASPVPLLIDSEAVEGTEGEGGEQIQPVGNPGELARMCALVGAAEASAGEAHKQVKELTKQVAQLTKQNAGLLDALKKKGKKGKGAAALAPAAVEGADAAEENEEDPLERLPSLEEAPPVEEEKFEGTFDPDDMPAAPATAPALDPDL